MHETSAGAVIFRKVNGERLYLLLHYPSGHWDFVKGKMEEGESTHQTVIRETQEETGISDLEFVNGFEEEIKYDFQFEGELIHKKVIFYLAETKTEQIIISHEHLGFLWTNFDNARGNISRDNSIL